MKTPTSPILERAQAHTTPNYAPMPWVADHGAGVHLYNTQGECCLDFTSGIGVLALGHSHPATLKAIATQSQKLMHVSNLLCHEPYVALCEKITQMSFGENVFLSNSGTEAIEGAIKLARKYFFERGETERTHIASFHGGFHGRTYGALSLSPNEKFHIGYKPLLPDTQFLPFNDIAAIDTLSQSKTAAVVIELIQGNSGVVSVERDVVQALAAWCQKTGTLLIVDEIQTGIGRTGTLFAYEQFGITPDIMTLAKALGGGLPIGALVTHKYVAENWLPGTHASTFGGNPLACVAGLAVLDTIEKDDLLTGCTQLGQSYKKRLQELQQQTTCIQEVRGHGLMIGLELDFPAIDLLHACREVGLLTTTAGPHVLRLLPPLIVTEAQLEQSVQLLQQAIQSI